MTLPLEITLLQGDCLEKLREIPSNSIESSVTDPPYFIGVLGEDWDKEPENKAEMTAFHFKWATEVFRILRPGAYLVAFNAPRTVHRMVCGIEDAGFEIRDELCWIHPQNIPKNHDAAKAIEKLFFEEWLTEINATFEGKRVRDLTSDFIQGRRGSELLQELEKSYGFPPWGVPEEQLDGTVTPAHPKAKEHAGEGTALKAVWEPIVLARKPFSGSLAKHLLAGGVGALNIEGSRIPTTDQYSINRFTSGAKPFGNAKGEEYETVSPVAGRYPPNLLVSPGGSLDPELVHLESVPTAAKAKSRKLKEADTRKVGKGMRFKRNGEFVEDVNPMTDGLLGAYTKFFVIPKPSSREKDEGLPDTNSHSTVKPISLMRYLVKMVTPRGGRCLDPFMGSGTTGVACIDEERLFTGIELSPVHFQEASTRIQFRTDNHDRSAESVLSLLPDE